MSQLTEKNQRFGTLDLVIMVGLVGVVVGISQAIISEVCTDHRRLEAHMKAESLAYRLAASDSPKVDSVDGSGSPAAGRGLASVEESASLQEGQIGEDPWGHPYRYSLKKDALGKVAEVSVWSSGADVEAKINHPIRYVYTAPLQSRNRLVPAVSN